MMFDFAPYYQRIAQELPNDCRIVEVGVANGDSALYMAHELHKQQKKFTLYLVDNMAYGGLDQLDTLWRNVADTGFHNSVHIIPTDSITASKKFNDNYLHFCFIDSSHLYQETKDSIRAWMPKLLDGYKLAGHDYDTHEEVRRAVNEVVPLSITREPIPGQRFKPHRLLYTYATERGFGIWEFKKDFYVKLNENV